jgi:D-3-phosphoglycerate dehydrogenase
MKFVALDTGYVYREDLLKVKEISGISDFKFYLQSPASETELIDRAIKAELLTGRYYIQFNRQVIEKLPKLKAIFLQSIGYDNVDIEFAKSRNVKVFNCAGYSANAVAEFVFTLALSLIRKVSAAQEHVKAGGVEYRLFEGSELRGKVIGVIGAGNVGRRIVEISKGFGMKAEVCTKNPSQARAKQIGIEKFSSLNEVLKNSDVIVLALPLEASTKSLIGKQELRLMKKSAILINAARQSIIDEYALSEALVKENIGGAALDLLIRDPFDINKYPIVIQEMVNLPNVIVTPHIASETAETGEKLGEVFLKNIEDFFKGDFSNCVNK